MWEEVTEEAVWPWEEECFTVNPQPKRARVGRQRLQGRQAWTPGENQLLTHVFCLGTENLGDSQQHITLEILKLCVDQPHEN